MQKQHVFVWLIILAFVTILTYRPIFSNGFVWDDSGLIYSSPFSRPLYSLSEVFLAKKQAVFRPVYYLFLNGISIVSQGNPTVLHAIQLIIHSASGFLVFTVFSTLFPVWLSGLGAALFLLHPIQTESVAYLAALGNPLAFLFGILAIYIRIRNRQSLLPALFLLLSILANEAGLSWIVIFVCYCFLYEDSPWIPVSRLLIPVSLLYLALRLGVSKASFFHFGYVPIAKLSFTERLATMPSVFLSYLSTTVFPFHLSIAQHWTIQRISFQTVGIPLLVTATIIGLVIVVGSRIRHKSVLLFRHYIFFTAWFIAGYLPYSQLVPLDMTVADRWFYLPLVGIIGMVITVCSILLKKNFVGNAGVIALASIVLIPFSYRTVIRTRNWHDPVTLYTHDLRINPESFDIHAKLAGELLHQNNIDEAFLHASKAVSLVPSDIASQGTLGVVYLKRNEPEKALPLFLSILHTDPENYLALMNIIYTYSMLGKQSEAIEYIQKTRTVYPHDPSLETFSSLIAAPLQNASTDK